MKFKMLLCLLPALFIVACGQGVVDVTQNSYEEKIVVEGLLIAGQPVGKIHLTRNFPVDADLRRMPLIDNVAETHASITDINTGRKVDLHFVEPSVPGSYTLQDYYWTANDASFIIEHDHQYRLDVTMPVEGRTLTASAVTTVPSEGLAINSINHTTLPYRAEDADGNEVVFEMEVQRSPNTDFYLATVLCQDPVLDSLIVDNPYEEIDLEDAVDDLNDYAHEAEWIQNTPTTAGVSQLRMYWYQIYFYGEYLMTVYAVDQNYAQFLQTYNDVQELDGNFHEAYFNLEGDGIGYFGSAVTDQVTITVTR